MKIQTLNDDIEFYHAFRQATDCSGGGLENVQRHSPTVEPKCSPAICFVIGAISTLAVMAIVAAMFFYFAK